MVNNRKRIKKDRMVSESELQVKTLIILFFIVVLVSVGIYFLTDSMIKRESNANKKEEKVTINYDIATVGTMFNRIESEYYVLLYSNKEDGNSLNSVLDTYRSNDNYVKTYYVDLDKKFNNSVLGDELVKKPKNSNEVKVKGATLYKFENGQVSDCISEVEKIIELLEQ